MKSPFFSELDVPGVMLNDFTAQHIAVDMRVNFRSCNGLMPQHTLDCAQVGTTFKQVRGEGVAEGMRADIFSDSGFLCQLLNQVENHDTGDAVSPAGEEDVIFKSFLDFAKITVEQPVLYFFDGTGGDRHQSLLTAFSFHFDETFVKIQFG